MLDVVVLWGVGEEAVVLFYRVDTRHLILSRVDLVQLILLHTLQLILMLHIVKLDLVVPRVV
jgi:hypothetical protein